MQYVNSTNIKGFSSLVFILAVVGLIVYAIASPFVIGWEHSPRDMECLSRQQDYDHDVEAQRDGIPGPHLLAMFARPKCVDNDGVTRNGG